MKGEPPPCPSEGGEIGRRMKASPPALSLERELKKREGEYVER
jgi:hypothetical protein